MEVDYDVFLKTAGKCTVYLFFMCAVFTVDMLPAEEIIFASDPQNQPGIWISNVNGRNARKLFDPPVLVQEISIQEGDRYIVCVGEAIGDIETGFDAYLFDTQKLNNGRKDTVLSMDWADKAYPVDPADSLVTTWGKLKIQKADEK